MIKKYKPNKVWCGIIIGGLTLMYLLALPGILKDTHFDVGFLILSVIAVPIVVLYPLGRSASLNGNKFCHTDYFFLKKCLNVNHIETISFVSTFGVGNVNRRLLIRERVDTRYEFKEVSMANPAFHRKTLAKIVQDLRQKNSNIQIDKDVENLLQKYT